MFFYLKKYKTINNRKYLLIIEIGKKEKKNLNEYYSSYSFNFQVAESEKLLKVLRLPLIKPAFLMIFIYLFYCFLNPITKGT